MDNHTEEKLTLLRELLLQNAPLAIAFSGGVDSSFLAAYAKQILGDQLMAVTLRSPAFAAQEKQDAENFCQQLGIRHLWMDAGEEILSIMAPNPPDRCYHCKKHLFTKLMLFAKEQGAAALADGTNADDLADYRPGIRALEELGVLSPLKEAGLTKQEIRGWLQEHNYPVWDKPAYACLASRIPYGELITAEKLRRIDALEEYLRGLGFVQCRVRHHEGLARIEVSPADRSRFFQIQLMDTIHAKAVELGFSYAALDLQGYRTGSLNPGKS